MRKLKLLAELEYDDNSMHGDNPESVDWFINGILLRRMNTSERLILHCNEIGDEIGDIKILEILPAD